jgi:hypothetical protein
MKKKADPGSAFKALPPGQPAAGGVAAGKAAHRPLAGAS